MRKDWYFFVVQRKGDTTLQSLANGCV